MICQNISTRPVPKFRSTISLTAVLLNYNHVQFSIEGKCNNLYKVFVVRVLRLYIVPSSASFGFFLLWRPQPINYLHLTLSCASSPPKPTTAKSSFTAPMHSMLLIFLSVYPCLSSDWHIQCPSSEHVCEPSSVGSLWHLTHSDALIPDTIRPRPPQRGTRHFNLGHLQFCLLSFPQWLKTWRLLFHMKLNILKWMKKIYIFESVIGRKKKLKVIFQHVINMNALLLLRYFEEIAA